MPVATIRLLIAIYVKNKWPLYQLDVNNAFLYGDLDEDIYMTIPQGFSDSSNKNKVCKPSLNLYMVLNKHLESGMKSLLVFLKKIVSCGL